MKRAAILGTVLAFGVCGTASAQTRSDDVQPVVCVPSPETRDLFLTNRLFPPFRVMRDTSLGSQADALDIRLCRFNGLLVYDVTLLNHDGRVVHRLVNATSGAALGGHAKP
jgi:hypothetical protein